MGDFVQGVVDRQTLFGFVRGVVNMWPPCQHGLDASLVHPDASGKLTLELLGSQDKLETS